MPSLIGAGRPRALLGHASCFGLAPELFKLDQWAHRTANAAFGLGIPSLVGSNLAHGNSE